MGAIDFSINEKLLCFLKNQLNLSWFLETGTFEGNSLDIAARHFEQCMSVELSVAYFEKAKARFKDVIHVELHQGSSPEIIARHTNRLQQSAGLFWLDAHWCVAENTAGEDSQSPLLAELTAIGKLHPHSVILIDDARLFLCAPPQPHRYQDWPNIANIVSLLAKLSDTHTFSVLNDVIAFYPQSMAKAFDRFAFENGVDWLNLVLSQRDLTAKQSASPPKTKKNRLWKRICRALSPK